MMKSIIAAFACLSIVNVTSALEAEQEKAKFDYSSIFDNESDFMKGFETGVLMRTKQGNIEDYGC